MSAVRVSAPVDGPCAPGTVADVHQSDAAVQAVPSFTVG